MLVADGDVVAVLNDGGIGDDLIDAGVDVAVVAEHAAVGCDAGCDVNLSVGAWMEVNATGAGRYRDDGRRAHVEGAVEGVVLGDEVGGGQKTCCGDGDQRFLDGFHDDPFVLEVW